MAAKEESLVLKYLKKNPDTDALDVSFGTDIDETLVKEALQSLLSKSQVSQKVSESGVTTWKLSSGPAAKVEAPKPSRAPDMESESTPTFSDEAPSTSGGTGKGFVLLVALLTAIVSIVASYLVGAGAIAAERAKFDLQLKNATDSVGFYRITTNQQLDAINQEIKKLQTPPAPEAKPAPAAKKAVKKAKKK